MVLSASFCRFRGYRRIVNTFEYDGGPGFLFPSCISLFHGSFLMFIFGTISTADSIFIDNSSEELESIKISSFNLRKSLLLITMTRMQWNMQTMPSYDAMWFSALLKMLVSQKGSLLRSVALCLTWSSSYYSMIWVYKAAYFFLIFRDSELRFSRYERGIWFPPFLLHVLS